jgi:hypothetical protein
MTLVVDFVTERQIDPVDTIEQIAAFNDWSFDRSGENEITISVTGNWTDYHISFTWMDDLEALHLACAFDLKVPDARRREVMDLMARINEQLWIGHFDLWAQEGVVIFRHALPLAGTETSPRQCETLLDAAVDTCERYFQAYQFVVWAGKTAAEAIESTLFETAGEA